MNDMRNGFDEEMKKRLYNYSEEPEMDMWEHIAPNIPKANVLSSGYFKTILGIVLLSSLVGLFFFTRDKGLDLKVAAANHQQIMKMFTTQEKDASSTQRVQTLFYPNPVSHNPNMGLAETWNGQRESIPGSLPKNTRLKEGNAINQTNFPADNNSLNVNAVLVPDEENNKSNGQKKKNSQTSEVTTINDSPDKKDKITDAEKIMLKEKIARAQAREIIRKNQDKRHRKFNMYFTAMPTFGYQRVESNEQDNIIIEGIKKIPMFSMNRLGVRAEIGLELPLSKKVKFFSGIMYYQRKQTIEYVQRSIDTTFIYTDPNGNILVETEFSSNNKSFEYELKNLGIQAGLNVVLKKKILLHTLGTGLEFQVALNGINSAAKTEGFTTNPKAYVFYNLYYRLQYPAEGRLRAVFQPTLNYSFYINQNLNAPFYVKPYGLGLNVGCTYNF